MTAALDDEHKGYAEFNERVPDGTDPIEWWRWRAFMAMRASAFWRESRHQWVATAEEGWRKFRALTADQEPTR